MSNMIEIERIIEIAKQAGKIMLSADSSKIKEKSGHANFCTAPDSR